MIDEEEIHPKDIPAAYINKQEIIQLAIAHIANLRRWHKHHGHKGMSVEDRIVLFLAYENERLQDVKSDALFAKMLGDIERLREDLFKEKLIGENRIKYAHKGTQRLYDILERFGCYPDEDHETFLVRVLQSAGYEDSDAATM
jgi:hypothetical protein